MGGKYSHIESGLNTNHFNNGDIIMIRNKKYPSTAIERFIADKGHSLWSSVGVVLCLPELENRMYLFETAEFHPHDNLISILSGTTVESGVRVVPLAERLSSIKIGSVCGVRKMQSQMREVENLRVPQHYTVLKELNRTMRSQAPRATNVSAATTWMLQKLGIIINPKYKVSVSDLRGNYLNKISAPGVFYAPLEITNIR
jgi:hypothetical protein